MEDIGANIFLNGLEDSGKIKSTILKWGHALIDELLSPPEEERIYELVLGADLVSPYPTVSSASFLDNSLIITRSPDIQDL